MSTRNALRIVLAEDNLFVREGLVSMLSAIDGFSVVDTAASMPELIDAVDRHRPDVVVTDIRMPPDNDDEGIRAAHLLRTAHPDTAVLVLSQFVGPSYAIALLQEGTKGRGYLLKDHVNDIDRFVEAIRTVAAGGSFIDDTVVDALVRSRTRMVDSTLDTLTDRERDVLSEMATGATNSVIAQRLGVGEHSVEKHSNSIFHKLGVTADPEVNRRVAAVLMFLAGERAS
jgi:DNA-binding NarL/FixJ family response regulator